MAGDEMNKALEATLEILQGRVHELSFSDLTRRIIGQAQACTEYFA